MGWSTKIKKNLWVRWPTRFNKHDGYIGLVTIAYKRDSFDLYRRAYCIVMLPVTFGMALLDSGVEGKGRAAT
jgi:hypothetical protein